MRAGLAPELGEEYTPSTEQLARLQEFGRNARSAWGTGAAARVLLPSVRSLRQLAMLERMCTSPGMARATIEAAFRIDVRPILPTITAPSLVIHAREDPGIPVQCGRYLADHIPGARYLEVDGVDHAYWLTDPDRILTGIEEFLTGSHAAPAQSHRALRTVLFTDIVASTQHAAATGDERWRAVLHRFGEITAELTERFGGTVVKSTGDGHLATFDGPTQAIRCAEALRAEAETLGIEIRIGIHTGECELLRRRHRGARRAHRGADPRPRRRQRNPWSPAPCVTWSSARALASRTVAASSCPACPGRLATPGGRSPRAAGRIGRGRTGVDAHPRPLRPQCAARTAP